jgi:hypothetical protein
MLDIIRQELELIVKFAALITILLLSSFYNYIRTLDRETLLNDVFLLKCIMQGKCIFLKDEGKIIVIEGHKRICLPCTCSNCATCINDDEKMECVCNHCDKCREKLSQETLTLDEERTNA